MTTQNSSHNLAQQSTDTTQGAIQEPTQPPESQTPGSHKKMGSPNPDHQGGNVKSTQQPTSDGAVAATEEEKGGSSE